MTEAVTVPSANPRLKQGEHGKVMPSKTVIKGAHILLYLQE